MTPTTDPISTPSSSIQITDIKAMQVGRHTLIKVETDAGLVGYGPCGGSGPFARDAIHGLHHGRLPHLGSFVGAFRERRLRQRPVPRDA